MYLLNAKLLKFLKNSNSNLSLTSYIFKEIIVKAMYKHLFLYIIFLPVITFAQHLSAEKVEDINPIFLQLNDSKEVLNNPELNHELVDLVEAYTVDSVFKRKFERHRVVGGGIIRLLGFRWLAVNKSRQKIVGWVNRHYLHGINTEAHFTEYDINYDLIPFLPTYKDLAYEVYQRQFDMKKSKKKKQEGEAPFIYPDEETDMTKYRFHCENTPATEFRSLLNSMFFPVHNNNPLEKHHNFEQKNPVMGMYGVLVLDCNHSCHPEIHPYEWIWWLNTTEESTSWNVGFIRDVSNRFKHWSSSPRTGEISIPFTFDLDSENWTLKVNHQMFGNFSEEGFNDLNLNGEYRSFNSLIQTFDIVHETLGEKTITVESNMLIPYESLQFAIKNLQFSFTDNLIAGELHLAMSINEVYTAEIEMIADKKVDDYTQLLNMMHGSFSSKAQAEMDTDYHDISLHMYPIWEEQGPGWFYVEQAVSSMPDKPYRQRIYHVSQIDNASFKSAIYLLPKDEAAIGKWKELSFFDRWSIDDLELKEGCDVYLKKVGPKLYKGSTLKGACLSGFRGATYANSIVEVSPGRLDSWDQGFNAEHQQIWGAEKGAYQFLRIP